MVTLTHHKKSVRSLAIHPTEYSFASGSAGGNNIKKWKCPEGAFVFNFSGHNAIINTLSVNSEGVFFSGGTRSLFLLLPSILPSELDFFDIAPPHEQLIIFLRQLPSLIIPLFWLIHQNFDLPFHSMNPLPRHLSNFALRSSSM